MSIEANMSRSIGDYDVVSQEWIDHHLPTVFSRWHDQISAGQAEIADLVIRAAAIRPGDRVLDVGCGSGNPTLTIANRVGYAGTVVGADPSAVFLEALRRNARKVGLENVETVLASAATLPFESGSFDAATCQMGAMFFADVNASLGRIREMVKTGRRAGFAVWGPEETNQLFTTFWRAARPHLPPQDTEPDPTSSDVQRPSRFSAPGSLSLALDESGFADIRESVHEVTFAWPGSAEQITDFWLELTLIGNQMESTQYAALRDDVIDAFDHYDDGSTVRLSASVNIASGRC